MFLVRRERRPKILGMDRNPLLVKNPNIKWFKNRKWPRIDMVANLLLPAILQDKFICLCIYIKFKQYACKCKMKNYILIMML